MKSIVNVFKNMQAFSFLVGMAWGATLGLILFCYLVPHGPKAIAMLRHYVSHLKGQGKIAEQNRVEFRKLYDDKAMQMSGMNHGVSGTNPYLMAPVTSEQQFLKDMTLHHEAAITMATQVLKLPNLHLEVKSLAEAIIKAQTGEITQMKAWESKWK